jgi:hypothetical protein
MESANPNVIPEAINRGNPTGRSLRILFLVAGKLRLAIHAAKQDHPKARGTFAQAYTSPSLFMYRRRGVL